MIIQSDVHLALSSECFLRRTLIKTGRGRGPGVPWLVVWFACSHAVYVLGGQPGSLVDRPLARPGQSTNSIETTEVERLVSLYPTNATGAWRGMGVIKGQGKKREHLFWEIHSQFGDFQYQNNLLDT